MPPREKERKKVTLKQRGQKEMDREKESGKGEMLCGWMSTTKRAGKATKVVERKVGGLDNGGVGEVLIRKGLGSD